MNFVDLLRRYVVDYTSRHDTSVCAEIMEPEYTLRMGAHVLSGRDSAYIPAASKQFRQFPGLGITVHEVVTNGDRLALRFSEHGASDGVPAAWGGIGLYDWNGAKLVSNFVEQDYLARRRQLKSGSPAAVPSPAVAPWDTAAVPTSVDSERVVREWLGAGMPGSAVTFDDGSSRALLADADVSVDDLFSAGDAVAFRVTVNGTYTGGLPELAGPRPATLYATGIVHVVDGAVASGHVISDRLGLVRA